MSNPKAKAKPFAYKPQHGLIVICANEADQKRKYETLKKRGLKVRVVTV